MEDDPFSPAMETQPGARVSDATAGKAFLAACGSVAFPGIGQWIAGRAGRGARWFGAMVSAVIAVGVSIAFGPTIIVAWVLTVIATAIFAIAVADAFACGRRSDRRMLGSAGARQLAGVALLVVAVGVWAGIATGGSAALRALGVRYVGITTKAMLPTLRPGDRIIARRTPTLRRWDVVIFHPPGRTDVFTQRIAGLPGDEVEIVDTALRINDASVQPPSGAGPYTSQTSFGPQTGCAGHPIHLGPNEYFLLGDNSAIAFDSRSFPEAAPGHPVGVVPRESILGRVMGVDWPPGRMRAFH